MSVSRQAARSKIAVAAEATATIAGCMIDARRDLEDAWSNGHGVLSEPYTTRFELTRARNKLNDALAALDDAQWPTSAEYDAAD